jgi:hypothetical protein
MEREREIEAESVGGKKMYVQKMDGTLTTERGRSSAAAQQRT